MKFFSLTLKVVFFCDKVVLITRDTTKKNFKQLYSAWNNLGNHALKVVVNGHSSSGYVKKLVFYRIGLLDPLLCAV